MHQFLAEALALNLTADYLCLSSLHVPSACFLHLCSTCSSYMRPWLGFFPLFFQLGVHRFLAEPLALNLTAEYLCLSSLHVPSACFLHLLLYLQLLHEALACFFPKKILLGVHRFLDEALALNLTADYLCLSSLHVPSACFVHLCSTSSSYMRPSLVFFPHFFSARSAQIPRRSPRVESYG